MEKPSPFQHQFAHLANGVVLGLAGAFLSCSGNQAANAAHCVRSAAAVGIQAKIALTNNVAVVSKSNCYIYGSFVQCFPNCFLFFWSIFFNF